MEVKGIPAFSKAFASSRFNFLSSLVSGRWLISTCIFPGVKHLASALICLSCAARSFLSATDSCLPAYQWCCGPRTRASGLWAPWQRQTPQEYAAKFLHWVCERLHFALQRVAAPDTRFGNIVDLFDLHLKKGGVGITPIWHYT